VSAPPLTAEADLGSLGHRTLSSAAIALICAGSVGVVAVLFALTSHSVAGFVIVTPVAVVAALVAMSWVVEGGRSARSRLAESLALLGLVLAIVPLLAVLGFTLVNGLKRFDSTFLTHSMRNVADSDPGGGAYHAIVGTLEQVLIATVISVPLGLMVSIYLVEYGSRSRYGRLISTTVDVMTGLPSIIAGLFILSFWVLALHQGFSGLAGALALTVLMIPVVIRTTEEMLRLVPNALREGSLALGARQWRTIVSVVIPAALPGITTGVMLAVARVMGETAPVLLTVFGNPAVNMNPFSGPQESLPLYIFSQAQLPNDTAVARAWSGALTLIILVIALTVAARLLTRRWHVPTGG